MLTDAQLHVPFISSRGQRFPPGGVLFTREDFKPLAIVRRHGIAVRSTGGCSEGGALFDANISPLHSLLEIRLGQIILMRFLELMGLEGLGTFLILSTVYLILNIFSKNVER